MIYTIITFVITVLETLNNNEMFFTDKVKQARQRKARASGIDFVPIL